MPDVIDLRSDTVTRPSAAMREAMAHAVVGDDVYGEDPTVNALQEMVAELFGMEAGLFVPSGVMANQLAIKAHTEPGDEVIVEYDSHIFQYETAAPSMMSHVQLHPVRGRSGVFDARAVEAVIRTSEYYYPRTRLLCIENTHNRAGGTIFPLELIHELRSFAIERRVRLHLDGARVWNAHIKTGTPLRAYGASVDSLAVCFSKGLGAPVGSMLLGNREFITRAHKYRKIFGGGMRQAGILAAAAHYAIEQNLTRLSQDHEHADRFAHALQNRRTFSVDLPSVQTNMVMLDFTTPAMTPDKAIDLLSTHGVLVGHGPGSSLRAVFHLDVSDEATDRVIERFTSLFE